MSIKGILNLKTLLYIFQTFCIDIVNIYSFEYITFYEKSDNTRMVSGNFQQTSKKKEVLFLCYKVTMTFVNQFR